MIQHDPSRVSTLNFPAPSGEGDKQMNCSVAGSDSRRPYDRTVATRGIRCLGAWARRRGEPVGDVGEKMGKKT